MHNDDSPNSRSGVERNTGPQPLDGPAQDIPSDAVGQWSEDSTDEEQPDPEHARRLAAIRTELLKRAQQRSPSKE
ncbi:MAG: hypothetical protein IPH05_15640 [Flavobacteriales bacterium]|jgi:hypothetical protein|nr:hypothetical protein [Flavobacteriales bacterium]MBK6549071.1 hypothetical protein [Flavobacteriales bacterium]MBK6884339.1 hypothetical protein [Flavobacteriales bacterium]MBK7100734.1 hypothetical protein [Flavobacteriales bacterium]MBK7111424.1 hypothetical protein [Flavobacteriales bacterium]